MNNKLYQFVYRLEHLEANHSHCMNRNNVSCAPSPQPQQQSSWPSLSFPRSSSKCSYSFMCPERTNAPIDSYLKFRGFAHHIENPLQQERALTAMFYFQYFYVYQLYFQQHFADECAERKGPSLCSNYRNTECAIVRTIQAEFCRITITAIYCSSHKTSNTARN